ncbi:MAG: STAS domain-containing protein [Planctomycetota bacterium]
MAIDWSEQIVLAHLSDEPALSDELTSVTDKLGSIASEEGAGAVPHVVLDFSAVTYLNSSNLAQLLRLKQAVSESGKQLRLSSLADEVWSVMMVTGLDKVFVVAPDTMTAIAGLQIEDAPGA